MEKELGEILLTHEKKYPLMEPTDAVKLIYQNEFGGGHMIKNEQACMDYLFREYARIPHDGTKVPEEIGNGFVRVHLAAVPESEVEALGHSFIRSAAEHTGTMDAFLQKLEVLKELTARGCFAFDTGELDAYLEKYIASGCPAVSHSEAYRQAYHPAYRVIFFETVEKLCSLFRDRVAGEV